jgi:hypothetical protein
MLSFKQLGATESLGEKVVTGVQVEMAFLVLMPLKRKKLP